MATQAWPCHPTANVELEVDSNLIGDPDALMTRIRNLFTIAK
jgi:hypothetical protein